MVPQTQAEYEKEQSVVREVFDPDTGRMRSSFLRSVPGLRGSLLPIFLEYA